MKSLALALVFCASWIHAADESSDREAIKKTVIELRAFTADFDNDAELARIRTGSATTPVVVISTEPWGEANIIIPGPGLPVIAVRNIRFLTPTVAMVDARANAPLVILLRKEGSTWKIASIRILADL